MLTFGSYYCFDLPSTLEDAIREKVGISDTQYNLFYTLYAWTNCVFVILGLLFFVLFFSFSLFYSSFFFFQNNRRDPHRSCQQEGGSCSLCFFDFYRPGFFLSFLFSPFLFPFPFPPFPSPPPLISLSLSFPSPPFPFLSRSCLLLEEQLTVTLLCVLGGFCLAVAEVFYFFFPPFSPFSPFSLSLLFLLSFLFSFPLPPFPSLPP